MGSNPTAGIIIYACVMLAVSMSAFQAGREGSNPFTCSFDKIFADIVQRESICFTKKCENPIPLDVGWIAQKIKIGFDTSLMISLMDTKVSLIVKVL